MTPARAWHWTVATRARRSAFTLAVIAAMASPFVTGSYKVRPYSIHDVPLTAKARADIIGRWGEDIDLESCEQIVAGALRREPSYIDRYLLSGSLIDCQIDREALKNGYRSERYQSLSKYAALNGAVRLATLMVTFFALTAAMAAVRKWWRWWW